MIKPTHSLCRPDGACDDLGGCFYKDVAPTALKNRIILTYEAEAQAVTTDAIIKKVFNAVPVP
jgi:MoxR-like ATPase